MLLYVDKQSRGQKKREYGIPFFDDLDHGTKLFLLHQLAISLSTTEDVLPTENVYADSLLAALENFVKESVVQEIETKNWSSKKFGSETKTIRELLLNAYASSFPKDDCPEMSSDISIFHAVVDRLFSAIRPKPYYWLADTELTKRKELMARLNIPNEYFETLTKILSEEQSVSLVNETIGICESIMKRNGHEYIDSEKCWWTKSE
jgi:hypothetical protein